MGPPVHTLSSSDDSNDSLPDLETSPLRKKPFDKHMKSHTLSSDDEEENKENEVRVDDEDYATTRQQKAYACNSDDEELYKKNELIFDDDAIVIVEENTQQSSKKYESKFSVDPSDAFNEDLPEIHDFTLISSEAREFSEEEEEKEKETQPLKPLTKKSRKEEVQMEKEAKRREREAIRLKKAAEKAEAKAQREAERTSKRAMKPGECMKYVIVQLDRRLLELAEGSQVISQLQEADLRYRVVDSPVAAATTILRVDPLTLQETLTEEAVLLLTANELVELVERQVYENGIGGLCQKCKSWKRELGISRLTLLTCGIESYLRNQKTNKNQNFRADILGEGSRPGRGRKRKVPGGNTGASAERISRVDIETALVMAQVEGGTNHRLMPDANKVGLFITQVTKAVAETPFKREKGGASFSWYAEGSSTNTVKIDKSGVGLLKLWHQQLRQFNNVGVEVAQAIAREYSSPCTLVEAYRRCSSTKEASLLLADIPVRRGAGPLVSTRKIGPELSKKIHLFFTTTQPEVSLGQKT
ncbi:crossover junction endonuclease EME1-like [Penaeus indicus]|uniref:crossover junction endonuclease EME1-like n=1 Tax=Penaeus indicus TaxID=29960 RepID=UPI00300D1E69